MMMHGDVSPGNFWAAAKSGAFVKEVRTFYTVDDRSYESQVITAVSHICFLPDFYYRDLYFSSL
jgi:hypothetical protein